MSAHVRKKGEAPKLRQQLGPLSRTKGHTKAARIQSSQHSADSRSRVIKHQREVQKLAQATAPDHALNPRQRAKLARIADRVACDETKLLAALREVGALTAADLAFDLHMTAPHSRLCGLRKAGFPIRDAGWVRQPWGNGRIRLFKLYRLEADE